MMIIFLTVISQCATRCSGFNIWDQMTGPGTQIGNNPGLKPGGVAGGFWGSLLGQDGHPKHQLSLLFTL